MIRDNNKHGVPHEAKVLGVGRNEKPNASLMKGRAHRRPRASRLLGGTAPLQQRRCSSVGHHVGHPSRARRCCHPSALVIGCRGARGTRKSSTRSGCRRGVKDGSNRGQQDDIGLLLAEEVPSLLTSSKCGDLQMVEEAMLEGGETRDGEGGQGASRRARAAQQWRAKPLSVNSFRPGADPRAAAALLLDRGRNHM